MYRLSNTSPTVYFFQEEDNSSELSFHSSEVSFDTSEEFFLSSVGIFDFLGSYWKNSSGDVGLREDV